MNQMLSPEITMSPRAHHIVTPQIILLIYFPMILSGTNISLTGLIFRDQINILCAYHLVFEYLPCNLWLLKNHFRKLRNLTVFIFIFLSHRNLTTFGQFHLISFISFTNHPQILGSTDPPFSPGTSFTAENMSWGCSAFSLTFTYIISLAPGSGQIASLFLLK